MARGQVLTIPSGSGQLVTTLSKEEKNSLAILNPNDGYLFIKMNGPASANITQWDWKLPSQSYGLFPGPWQSIGLYYVDQSGSNRSADINVYDNDAKLIVPEIQAVGRAVAQAGSALDISQGTQPANPPASTIRLWTDGQGNLHKVDSTGADEVVLDNSNWQTYVTMTGDVMGPLTNTTIHLRNNQPAWQINTSGTQRYLMLNDTGNSLHIYGEQGVYFNNANGGAALGNFDAVGNFGITGNVIYFGGAAANINWNGSYLVTPQHFRAYWLHTTDGSNGLVTSDNGALYLRSASGSVIMDSGPVSISSSLSVGAGAVIASSLNVTGNQFYLNGSGGAGLTTAIARGYYAFQTNTGQGDFILGGGSSILYFHPNLSVYLQQNYPYLQITGFAPRASQFYAQPGGAFCFGDNANINIGWDGTYIRPTHSIAFNTTGNQILWAPNGSYISGDSGYHQGSKRALKEQLVKQSDASLLGLVSDTRLPVTTYKWNTGKRKNIGFIADDLARVLPQYVTHDKNGEADGFFPQELMAILWGAVRELNRKVDSLA